MTAFYFDRTVFSFGTEVESAMDEAAEGAKNGREVKRKRQMALARYLRNADGTHAPGTFRDPASLAKK